MFFVGSHVASPGRKPGSMNSVERASSPLRDLCPDPCLTLAQLKEHNAGNIFAGSRYNFDLNPSRSCITRTVEYSYYSSAVFYKQAESFIFFLQ